LAGFDGRAIRLGLGAALEGEETDNSGQHGHPQTAFQRRVFARTTAVHPLAEL
jgi:hypothetical protein